MAPSLKSLTALLPMTVKGTFMIRALGLLKIPMLFFVSPSVVELDDYRCVVKIPLTRRSKNHLGSMYFGALAVGADCSGGLIAWKLLDEMSKKRGKRMNLVFKDFKAQFLKRPEGDVYFACEDGQAIRQLVEKVAQTGERDQISVHVKATVPSKSPDEAVAEFVLTLSIK
jgi:acyl-coenzyme A thioesterase PaaI-like protein